MSEYKSQKDKLKKNFDVEVKRKCKNYMDWNLLTLTLDQNNQFCCRWCQSLQLSEICFFALYHVKNHCFISTTFTFTLSGLPTFDRQLSHKSINDIVHTSEDIYCSGMTTDERKLHELWESHVSGGVPFRPHIRPNSNV